MPSHSLSSSSTTFPSHARAAWHPFAPGNPQNTYNNPVNLLSDEEDAMARSKSSTANHTSPQSRRSSGRFTASVPSSNAKTITASSGTPSPRKGRALRPRKSFSSYADENDYDENDVEENDEDEDGDASDGQGSYEDVEEDDSTPSTNPPSPTRSPQPERGSNGSHSLRPRASLAMPEGLRDYIDTDKALGHKRRKSVSLSTRQKASKGKRLAPGKACVACRVSRRKCDRKKPRCSGCVKMGSKCFVKEDGQEGDEQDGWVDESETKTVRGEIRKGIEETTRKRERFLVQYAHLFEALLPEGNYIQKLKGKLAMTNAVSSGIRVEGGRDTPMSGTEEEADPKGPAELLGVIPYKLLEKQPSK